jgi:hypothetical protein
MFTHTRWPARLAVLGGTALALLAAGPASASGTFVQRVHLLATFHGPTTGRGAYFGWAVSELHDITGDGVTDLIVGEVDGGGTRMPGRVWVYSGRTHRLLYKLTGRAGDQSGFAVADAGDVNGDGVDDIISGAPGSTADAPGAAIVYSGATGQVLVRLHGHAPGSNFGAAVAGVGDVNGDGRDDLLVGAPGSGQIGSAPGKAYVISGRTFHVIRRLSAWRRGDSFGSATDGSADLNGDGVPDLVIGAGDAGPTQGGAVYVYSGRTGRRLFRINAPRGARQFGRFFAAGVGDVNGDGVPDIYAGDYGADTRGTAGGFAGVYSGADGSPIHRWAGAAGEGLGPGREAGDVNGDGRVDIIAGYYTSSDGASQAGKVRVFSGATGKPIRTITSTTENENFGFDAVGVGDTNGNGSLDYLVSAASLDTVYLIDGRGQMIDSTTPHV